MKNPSGSPDFDSALARVRELCAHFEARRAEIKAPGYKEDAARNEFITPFFEALGWDVRNTAHRSVYEKDVVTEKREDIAGTARSADYAFRRPGTHLTAFFVEAKKPSVDIRSHGPCHQAVLYGWNASTPLVVLTDFEQLLILDARSRPNKADAARHVLKENGAYTCADYRDRDKFAEIWGLLSRERVAGGSLEKAAAALPKLSGRIQKDDLFARGTRPVDEEFLAQMELWREKLAKSLKRSNHQLDGERLTSLTQRILDRLVFLRFLEDRGIERDVTFADFGKGGSAWRDFLRVSKRLNARYNGILYKNDPDGCEDPALVIDDPAFANVVENLVPQNSDYLFGSIPVTILGSIYERFLGNVIVARDKTAIVEPKPEVRKAGGVYYTPDYIVRYIVEQTVGRCIAGKKPAEIEKLRFADIACGSGSFLVEVFACLIRYHLAWYLADGAEKWEKRENIRKRDIDGDYVLTLAEKRRILLACVYGVDLDPSAVEVTQLSLYLKLMEDESFPSTQSLFDFEKHALLPDLRGNIICGNSLVETDIADDLFGISVEQQEAIRPLAFRWHFPKTFNAKGGGFDAIVGNPPYVRVQRIDATTSKYIYQRYKTPTSKADLSLIFMERALELINPTGLVGYIVTSQWLTTDYGSKMREYLANGRARRIMDFGSLPVFANVDTYPAIVVLGNPSTASMEYAVVTQKDNLNDVGLNDAEIRSFPPGFLSGEPWSFDGVSLDQILNARKLKWVNLEDFGHVLIGLLTGMDSAFVVTADEAKILGIENGVLYPYAYRGHEVSRFGICKPKSFVIYPYTESKSPVLITQEEFKRRFPNAFDKLLAQKKELVLRMDSRRFYAKGSDWYRHLRPGSFDYIRPEKLIFKGVERNLVVGLLGAQTAFNGANTPAFIPGDLKKHSLKYLLGVLNSKAITHHLRRICPPKLGGYTRFNANNLNKTPIRLIDFTQIEEVSLHANLVKLVDKMLAAKKAEEEATDGVKREHWNRQCKALDRQIDGLVYELYGLSDEEIALVEGGA